jgi:hypothetical protein
VSDSSAATRRSPFLLLIALFGLMVPNGYFILWATREWNGLAPVLANHLAMGFILDAALATAVLAWYFARRPIGRVGWPTFVLLSLVGGLGFSLPLFYWLNGDAAGAQTSAPGVHR